MLLAGGDAVDQIAVTLSEPGAILAVLSYNRKIDMRAEVELPHEALAAESLVADCRKGRSHWREEYTALGEPCGWSFAGHGVKADALHPSLAGVEGLAAGEESGVGIAVGQAHLTVIRAEQGSGIARTVVERVAQHLNSELVVSHLAEDVAVADAG